MNNDLLIIGMSPGNGYFKQEVIDRLLPFALSKYQNIAIFIPDIPAVATYIALGYPENIARRKKAVPQGNNFRNKIKKTIQEKNLDTNKVYVFNWSKENIEEKDDYKKAYKLVSNLYRDNKFFKNDINSATETVLTQNPFKKKEITSQDIEIGTHYILSEFAFMLFLKTYIPEYKIFTYGYHNPWPVWEKFIAGEYDKEEKDNLKFLLLPDFSLDNSK